MLFKKDTTEELDIVADNLSNFAKAIVGFIEKVMAFFDEIKKIFEKKDA